MNNDIYNDIMEALCEVKEYQNGNIDLREDIIEIPDIDVLSRFSLLSDNDKFIVSSIIDRLLPSSSH